MCFHSPAVVFVFVISIFTYQNNLRLFISGVHSVQTDRVFSELNFVGSANHAGTF